MFCIFSTPSAIVQVGFEFPMYSTTEGQGPVEVCVSILNSADVTTQFFTVQLFSQNNSATGERVNVQSLPNGLHDTTYNLLPRYFLPGPLLLDLFFHA